MHLCPCWVCLQSLRARCIGEEFEEVVTCSKSTCRGMPLAVAQSSHSDLSEYCIRRSWLAQNKLWFLVQVFRGYQARIRFGERFDIHQQAPKAQPRARRKSAKKDFEGHARRRRVRLIATLCSIYIALPVFSIHFLYGGPNEGLGYR